MSLREDSRAQSIQIGAVLLFAVLIILLATYQAFIVPNQNREIEANHVDTVTQQMAELRNAIVSVPGTGAGRAITLTLGVEYPSRTVAVNPPTPAGTVRTVGTTTADVNLTVANAVATDGEVDDRWTGVNRTFNTGAMAFRPGYNEYRNPPTIVYENSLLYHRFDSGDLTRAGQRFVDGRQLRLITLNGSMDRAASDSISVDVRPVSASTRTISITNETDANVVVDVASRYNASQWEAELREDGEFTDQTGYVVSVTDTPIPDSDFQVVHVELAQDEVYTLQMAKVGVGTSVDAETVSYLTDVQGDGASIQEGSPTKLVVEARDAYNNPVSGVRVSGRVGAGGGGLDEQSVVTDDDGRASFQYDSADDVSGGTQQAQIEFSYVGVPDTGFDADAAENVSVTVSVQDTDAGGGGGGGGAYSVTWTDPSTESANSGAAFSGCDGDRCTWDVGASSSEELDLNATLSPAFQGINLEFAVNDTTVATVAPTSETTGSDGAATTTLSATADGTVAVLASGNDGSDVIDVVLTNVVEAGLQYVTGSGSAARAGPESRVDFDIRNDASSQVTITGIRIESSDGSLASVQESNGGSGAGQREVYIDSGDDGYLETGFGSYDLGTDATLSNSATLDPGEQAQVTIAYFENNGGQTVSAADKPLTITLYRQNGDSTTFSFTPPGY
jgi:hypothetical protein